jgi:phosphoglycerate dehydrogenase-like enzyme
LDNVVLAPHVGKSRDASAIAEGWKCVDNILDYLAGRALERGLLPNAELVGRAADRGAAAEPPWQSKR